MSRQEILEEWPPDFDKPGSTTLFRWLERAVRESLILSEGSGRKADPFRYWLAEREAVWKQDPLYQLYEQSLKDKKLMDELASGARPAPPAHIFQNFEAGDKS